MRYGCCCPTTVVPPAGVLDHIEENVQAFLRPRDADEAAWRARLATAQRTGLPIVAANCFLPADLPCVGPQVDRRAILAWSRTAFRRAAEAGMGVLVFGSGGSRRIPEGWSPAAARRQLLELLRVLAPMAFAHGITLALEPLNRGECNLINTVDEAADVVREAEVPGLGIVADLYHMALAGETPAAIARAGSLIAHVHVAERARRTPPGRDGDDFRPWFLALVEIGYAGDVSLECNWSDLPAELPAAMAELRRQAEAASGALAAVR